MIALRLVTIRWVDASAEGAEWESIVDFRRRSMRCVTAGYLIHEDEESVTVATTISEDPDQYNSGFTIPRRCIDEIVEVAGEAASA